VNNTNGDQLYQLLPAIYRLRDGERGALRGLIEVLSGQAEIVEADIARLYENWFIETCGEWVVPYIGDLLGVRGLLPAERAGWSQRALVANTLHYRQRKGAVPLLEQLAHDVAGWAARAVEFYGSVSSTTYLDHLRPGQGGTADLKSLGDATLVGSAFDPLAYTPDVRLMSGTRQAPQWEAERPVSWQAERLAGVGRGRPNLPNLGLFIWRLRPYWLQRVTAYSHHDGKRFQFHPLGTDIQLFNAPAPGRDFFHKAGEHELPVALRTDGLSKDLEGEPAKDRPPERLFFGDRPAFEIYLGGNDRPVDWEDVQVCDLGEWDLLMTAAPPAKQVLVDPERGRIFVSRDRVNEVRVSYGYVFSDDLGGGPYDRKIRGATETCDSLIVVGEPARENEYPLSAALDEWKKSAALRTVLQISSNATFLLPEVDRSQKPPCRAQSIELKGRSLVIQAGNGYRPVIVGDLQVIGNSPDAELTLSGLLLSGKIELTGELGRLRIVDCTLVPGIRLSSHGIPLDPQSPSIVGTVKPGNSLQVTIEHSILGPICLPKAIKGLSVSDSIIDAPESSSLQLDDVPSLRAPGGRGTAAHSRRILAPQHAHVVRPNIEPGELCAIASGPDGKNSGPSTCLERVTVFGAVRVRAMPFARDVLFTKPVKVTTSVRRAYRCYLPARSNLPKSSREDCPKLSKGQFPAFTARRYGEPGYAQLSLDCPVELRTEVTNGGELGAFHNLHQPQREAALLAQCEEYLRFGLELGLIYVS
jgi:hypothetical protein